MATVQRKLVHKQFNSPIGLYSENNVKSTLNRELKAFSNGTMGVDCDDNAKPANLANSAVLKLLEEEERNKQIGGVKRVTWPPEHEYQARAASQTRQSPAIQPQHRQPSPYPHYQNGGYNPSGPNPSASYRQPSPAANYQNPQQNYPQQNYPGQQQSSNYPQSGYQQPNYQQKSQFQSAYQQPGGQQQQQQQPSYQVSNGGYQQQQPGYQQSGYQQPGYQQSNQQPGYQPGYQQGNQQQGYQPQSYQQPGVQRQISEKSQYPSAQSFSNPDPTFMRQTTPSYLPAQQSAKPPASCTAAFTGGVSLGNKPPVQSQAPNSSNWSHVQPSRPVQAGYVQPQYNQQLSQPSYSSESANVVNQNQYQPQQTYQQQQHPYQQQQQQPPQYQQQQQQQQQQLPPVQQNQYQTNQSVQPQPQKQYRPVDNFYRQPSPGTITLRKELPVTQRPPLIYASEPAANSFGGGGNMRGDQKWPPEEVKRQSEVENEQRRQLALGPAFRPRRVNKDYRPFFERHALNATYPGYRAPPGTQHYGYQYPQYPQYNQ